MKKKYSLYALGNLILGLCSIVLYLPYTFRVFKISGFDWLDIAPDLFKANYSNVLIGFGAFILLWIILVNAISIINYPNIAKTLFKTAVIVALILPLTYVLALRSELILKIWLKYFADNIKTMSSGLIFISCGLVVLGLLYNFTRRKRANLHHILQAIAMCALLILLVMANGWCWQIISMEKAFGLLMGLLAVYFPVSSLILYMFRNIRY